MSGAAVLDRRADERQHPIAEALCAQWRMFERVTVAAVDGGGYRATIYLNQTVVRGAIEQQGASGSPARLAATERRRAKAIAECVQRFNATRSPGERIRDYEVIAYP